MSSQNEKDVDQLNSFLKGELSAVETYGQCIEKLDEPHVVEQLRRLRSSHEQRAQMLRNQIMTLGGDPANGSGIWGSFAKLIEGGAKLFGKSAAISTLEEGEDHGQSDYEKDISKLSPSMQSYVRQNILPEQKRTHDALSALAKSY